VSALSRKGAISGWRPVNNVTEGRQLLGFRNVSRKANVQICKTCRPRGNRQTAGRIIDSVGGFLPGVSRLTAWLKKEEI
jgi:hypothetical protein